MNASADVTDAEVVRWLERIESKLDKITGDHEDRLRRLERAVWVTAGISGAGIASGIGALSQAVLG